MNTVTSLLRALMFIQTVIQHLLGKRKKEVRMANTANNQELSPMAQSIMQKLAEHEKNHEEDPHSANIIEKSSSKTDS
jgi:hypothetical protein